MSDFDDGFTVKTDHFDDSLANRKGFVRMLQHGTGEDAYQTGEFCDPRGIVSIYRQSDLTRLDFCYAGRLFMRTWERHFGDRTLSRLARAFVSDVLSGDIK